MSDEATITISLRDQCKAVTQEEFTSSHTKAQLEALAGEANVDAEALATAKTKADITALIYGQYKFPDPALRGTSTIASPVAAMWALLNDDLAANGAEGRMKRSVGVKAGEKLGIAHYTARTQYQAWFEATDRGTKPLTSESDAGGLPRAFAVALGIVTVEPVTASE